MAINSNSDLRNAVDQAIKDSGVSKSHIAKQLGVSRQQVDHILNKKGFSLDDANKVLNIIGLYAGDTAIKNIDKTQ